MAADAASGAATACDCGQLSAVHTTHLAHLRHDAKEQSDAADLGKMLESVSVTISQKAGENDQLFGSVTAKDIADSLESQGYTIERRKIQLPDPIKTLGDHTVPVRLHRDVTTNITVHVVKDS